MKYPLCHCWDFRAIMISWTNSNLPLFYHHPMATLGSWLLASSRPRGYYKQVFHFSPSSIISLHIVETYPTTHLAPVFRRLDRAIHWINLYPVDNAIRFAITYPLDSDLSVGQCYSPFIQLGPDVICPVSAGLLVFNLPSNFHPEYLH